MYIGYKPKCRQVVEARPLSVPVVRALPARIAGSLLLKTTTKKRKLASCSSVSVSIASVFSVSSVASSFVSAISSALSSCALPLDACATKVSVALSAGATPALQICGLPA